MMVVVVFMTRVVLLVTALMAAVAVVAEHFTRNDHLTVAIPQHYLFAWKFIRRPLSLEAIKYSHGSIMASTSYLRPK